MKNTFYKISFCNYKKYALIFLCAFFVSGAFCCNAQTAGNAPQTKTQNQTSAQAQTQTAKYYLVPLTWNVQNNTLKLEDNMQVTLTSQVLTKDIGGGSQFYAFIANSKLQYAIFDKSTKSTKYYLGQWKLPEGKQEGEIKVTIPYFEGASKIYILDAKTNKLAAAVDVFELSGGKVAKIATSASSLATPVAKSGLQINQNSNRSTIMGWVVPIVILLILIGIGYLAYRFYKKRKNVKGLKDNNHTNPQNNFQP